MEDSSDSDDFMNKTESISLRPPPPIHSSSSDEDPSDELPSLLHVNSKTKNCKDGGKVAPRKAEQKSRVNLAQVKKRISEINKLRDIDRKCSDLISKKNVLEQTEEVIKNHELINTDTPPLTPDQLLSLTTGITGQETALSLSPDLQLFVNPIMYMDDITAPPPSLKNCKSLSFFPEGSVDSNEGLRDLVVNKFLLLAFRSEPCPVEVLFWLLEISCLSHDLLTRMSAFSILVQLLKNSGLLMESTSTVYYAHIVSILIKLGVTNEDSLSSFKSQTVCEVAVHSERDVEMLQSSVKYITTFITIMNQMDNVKFDNHEQYVPLLLKLAMDKTICQSLVSSHVSTCLSMIAESATSDVFERIQEVFLSAMRVYAYSGLHYHYCVYLLWLLPVSSLKLQNMHRCLIRFVLESVAIMSNESTVTDLQVVQSVVGHYLQLDIKTVDYQQLYAVMTILAMLVKQPDMNWTSDEAKSSFLDDLGCLGTKKIKENVAQAMEIGTVKDLIIHMKLDLDQETQENSRQTNLFDFFIEQSQDD